MEKIARTNNFWTFSPKCALVVGGAGTGVAGLIYLKITGKTRETRIPFGPFLCIAGLVSLFYGKRIVEWYLIIL